jgi:aldose 1-epimerase
MKLLTLTFTLGLSLFMTACNNETSSDEASLERLSEAEYGEMADDRSAKIFTLKNKAGMVAKVTEYGAILVSLETPDRDGKLADITHGYDTLEGWLTNTSYFGSSVGRFGNRIADGKFTLDGKEYTLAKNNDPGGIECHLHGGLKGFDKVLWSGKSFEKDGASGRDIQLPEQGRGRRLPGQSFGGGDLHSE